MYADLHQFVEALDAAGELCRIVDQTSPVLEIAAITDLASKGPAPRPPSEAAQRVDPLFHHLGGPALLFENVAGSEIPVLINAYGSYRRMEMALGCEAGGFEAIARRIGELVQPAPPRSLAEGLARARQFAPLLRIGPRMVRRAPCQEVVETGDAVDLTRLPLLRCWPFDGDLAAVGYPAGVNAGIGRPGHPAIDEAEWERSFRGRYVTFAGIHTIHADDRDDPRPRSHNIGMYRVQLLGKDRMAMHWHMHHDGAAHWRSWKRRGEPMPVAIVFGGEAVLPYAATAPLPPGLSELLMAGFLNRRGIELARCRTVPLRVPANAEIVIEGYVSTKAGFPGFDPREPGAELGPEAVFEGPFGDHTGFYSLPDRYPLLRVTAVTRRRKAILPATIVGLPPQEDYYLGKATERLFLPLLRVLIPDVVDYDLPLFGSFHDCAFVQISKAYPLQARRVMHAIWGAGQMAWTKMIVVVDDDVDVHDRSAVLGALCEHCDPRRDLEIVRGPLDILDHAAPRLGAGSKIGFDATRKVAGEETPAAPLAGPWPPPQEHDRRRLLQQVRELPGVRDAEAPQELAGWLFLSLKRAAREDVDEAIDRLGRIEGLYPFVVVLGPDVDCRDIDHAMFHLCANADPGRDLVGFGRTALFDATPKRPGEGRHGETIREWPPIIEMDPAVQSRATRRWRDLASAHARGCATTRETPHAAL